MITPQYLKKNSRIAILSPSGYINPDFVSSAADFLIKNGYEVEVFPSCLSRSYQMAGTDEQRLTDLQTAFNRSDIDVILCSRGGYGANHLIDKIDMTAFCQHPKWLLGFSDITNLHLLINNHNIKSLHCQMAKAMHEQPDSESVKNIFRCLRGEKLSYAVKTNPLNRCGRVEAELVGGNLSILYSLQASRFAVNCKGKILFIEDLNEYLYHLDRMMLNLKFSGCLANLAGLVVGAFTDMKDNSNPFGKTAYEIIARHTCEYDYPVIFDFPVGHISDNQPLVEGGRYRLQVGKLESKLEQVD